MMTNSLLRSRGVSVLQLPGILRSRYCARALHPSDMVEELTSESFEAAAASWISFRIGKEPRVSQVGRAASKALHHCTCTCGVCCLFRICDPAAFKRVARSSFLLVFRAGVGRRSPGLADCRALVEAIGCIALEITSFLIGPLPSR